MSAPQLFRFEHEAMNTQWLLLIPERAGIDRAYAASAADAVWTDVNRLEDELSRFRPHSDIGRLRAAKTGERISLGLAAWDCLSLAKDVTAATDGAFDVAVGPLYELWRGRHMSVDPPSAEEISAAQARCGSHHFTLDPADGFGVLSHLDHLQLDLGAIGKGYALDEAAALLRDPWQIHDALLVTGGGSTVLAHGLDPLGQPWQAVTSLPSEPRLALPSGQAISMSGFDVQGSHIIDPRSGRPLSTKKQNVCAIAPGAALSDALSTAFLVLGRDATQAFCHRHPDVRVLWPE
jgi:FAD:protein FMN transferase